MRFLILIIILALSVPALAQQPKPVSYEATNPKATDNNFGNAAVPQTLTATGPTQVYYSPELPIAPGVTAGFVNVTITQATGNVSVTVTPLYSAGQTGTTTASDQTSSSPTTSLAFSGTSPYSSCTPIKLFPGAKTVRLMYKNIEGSNPAILKSSKVCF
jgi:hypothetical protein